MENEYKELLKEQYVLFRHLNISFEDQDRMTNEDRRFIIDQFIKERQAEIDASSGSSNSNSNDLPPSGGLVD